MSVRVVLFSIYNFFRSGYSHENSGLALKLVKFFDEPMNIRTQFSIISETKQNFPCKLVLKKKRRL